MMVPNYMGWTIYHSDDKTRWHAARWGVSMRANSEELIKLMIRNHMKDGW